MKILPRLALVFFASIACLFAAEVPRVSPADAAKLVAEGKAILIDVREPAEWAESGVAAPALTLAKSEFDAGMTGNWKDFLSQVGDKQVITYCKSGRRSDAVATALAEKGVKVANAGGFQAWQDAGLPVRQASEPAKQP
jgi:rhodanese-related sulfurtransferase